MLYYHVRNEVPVYVRYRIQDAWGWCMGMIQRDDVGWEVGGGFRIGSLYTPMVDSCQCMAKPIQYCKVKLKKKKRNTRKNKGAHNCAWRFSTKIVIGIKCFGFFSSLVVISEVMCREYLLYVKFLKLSLNQVNANNE